MEKLVIILGFFFAGAIFSVCSLPKDKVPTGKNVSTHVLKNKLAIFSLGNIVPYAGINDLVNSTVEGMRPDLPDPLVLEDPLNLNLTEDIINGTLDIQDIRVTGLKGLLVPYLLLVMPTFLLHFEFVVPVIEINAQYKTDIDLLGLLNVYGNGSARIALNNVQLKGTTVVSLSPSMSMKDLDIEVRLQSVDVDIQGLLYDEGFSSFASGLITLLAEWLIVPYVNNNASAIGDIVGPILEDVINGLLSGTTTVDPDTHNRLKHKNLNPASLVTASRFNYSRKRDLTRLIESLSTPVDSTGAKKLPFWGSHWNAADCPSWAWVDLINGSVSRNKRAPIQETLKTANGVSNLRMNKTDMGGW
ncbi:hypothetical protein Zmor_023074 [Zophobas morio]|uniref:Uncharacterized protein n=1 Tax=Zophobas morio TaxID=2755281 RepID=A0AA38HWH1_9CUCU|nr:hypothetical protein Zmor_023074 [Zophobas morio]